MKEMTTNTFGDDIDEEEVKPLKPLCEIVEISKETPKRVTLNKTQKTVEKFVPLSQKEPKSKKVKFSSLAKYIITELALLDEEWEQIEFEICFEEGKEDGDEAAIENLEARQFEIIGAVNALFLLGRNFGVSKKNLVEHIPNINSYEEEIKPSNVA